MPAGRTPGCVASQAKLLRHRSSVAVWSLLPGLTLLALPTMAASPPSQQAPPVDDTLLPERRTPCGYDSQEIHGGGGQAPLRLDPLLPVSEWFLLRLLQESPDGAENITSNLGWLGTSVRNLDGTSRRQPLQSEPLTWAVESPSRICLRAHSCAWGC